MIIIIIYEGKSSVESWDTTTGDLGSDIKNVDIGQSIVTNWIPRI